MKQSPEGSSLSAAQGQQSLLPFREEAAEKQDTRTSECFLSQWGLSCNLSDSPQTKATAGHCILLLAA